MHLRVAFAWGNRNTRDIRLRAGLSSLGALFVVTDEWHQAFVARALVRSLRGEMVVVEVDQEKGVIIASTYLGQPVDPRPVICEGVQVKMFEKHRIGA